MASTMNVAIHLQLRDGLTGNLRNVIDQLQRFGRAAQDINRHAVGSGWSNQLNRLHGQIRGLASEVRNLVTQFNQLGHAVSGASAGGSFAQRQITDMRALIALQQQAIANNARMVTGPGTAGTGATIGRGVRIGTGLNLFGRSGFGPNSSLADRFQYRGVNMAEQALATGALDFDRARTQLEILGLPAEVIGRAEALARQYSTIFRSLSPGHILDTFREIVTQFQTPDEAFRFLPHLLRVQDWQVLSGDTIEQAREGMLRLVRAIGLSGRLIGPGGEFTEQEAGSFLEAYIRARMIGGRDVSPDQAFQLMKYLKTSGQTLSSRAILEGLIAMPDIRASTFGNQLNQLIIQLTGRSTQAAQRAMVAAGLGRITATEGSGPHSFQVIDEVMLRDNPFAWVQQHITGPAGYLRRIGIDPLRATSAQIATALRPLFSNQSAENIANMIVNQRQEWLNQIMMADSLNLTEERRHLVARGSLWHGLVAARSQIMNAFGTIAESFKFILLPPIQLVASGLQNLAALVDPRTGNPFAHLGLVAGGLMGSFFLVRALARGMGPIGRMLLGGGLGFAFGGIGEALMGAVLLRSLGGGTAGALGTLGAGAAGAAATAAGMTLGRRILAGLGFVLRRIPGFLLLSGVIAAIEAVANNWETVKTRILAVWEDLRQAAPIWLGGEGRGWKHLAQSEALRQTARDARNSPAGQLLEHIERNYITGPAERFLFGGDTSIRRFFNDYINQTPHTHFLRDMQREGTLFGPFGLSPRDMQSAGRLGGVTVNAPINVTVNVQTNANPNAIGEAAGTAVRSGLRGALSDVGAAPY